ncbi:MAG: DUF2225 domain-containing protein [Candidatus Auribacterota bacterium]|jgi:hypothetical protein|nr:DUF2225 domain-containing protein [Candidatus Auribacterota bacterium]
MINPFQSKQITCPVCLEISEISVLISEVFGKYFPVTHEKDQYVSQWKWTDEQWQHINPYLYSIVMCPKCYYSNFIDSFTDKQKSTTKRQMRYLKEKLNEISGFEKDLIRKIAEVFLASQTDHSHETAVMGMILTIFYQRMIMERKDFAISYTLPGRLYLRLSWLYREQFANGQKDENNQCAVTPIVSDMLDTLRNFHSLNKQIETQIKTMNEESSEQVYTIVLFLEEATKRLAEKTEEILSHIDSARGQAGDERSAIIKKSYTLWNWLPKNEAQAVAMAADCFVQAANNDYEISEKGACKILELAAYLYAKIGNKEGSNNCLRQIINLCYNQRMNLMKKLQKNTSIAQKSDIELEVKRLNTYIEDITYQYKYEENQQSDNFPSADA